MTESASIDFRRVTAVEDVRQLLLDIHVEVRGDFGLMGQPFQSVERFNERLSSYSSRPGWEAVLGYAGEEPVGFAFAVPLVADTRWWTSMRNPLPRSYTEETGTRTLALNEILVRKPWRGTGVARRLHDELISGRSEERVTLLVNPDHGGGKLKAVYEAWGYQQIGTQQPFSDSPVYAVMMRPMGIASGGRPARG
ncbi:N-acetyltransferase [Streptomyces sparsogenes]|uniref:N-acetyltransferase n=1 Tax=Streptomyces sparsogenes TaxID=67365 RepID=UPI0033C370A6